MWSARTVPRPSTCTRTSPAPGGGFDRTAGQLGLELLQPALDLLAQLKEMLKICQVSLPLVTRDSRLATTARQPAGAHPRSPNLTHRRRCRGRDRCPGGLSNARSEATLRTSGGAVPRAPDAGPGFDRQVDRDAEAHLQECLAPPAGPSRSAAPCGPGRPEAGPRRTAAPR